MEVSALTHTSSMPGLRGPSPLLRLQSDERLIALTRRGQHAAFETLCSRYQSRLLSFCRHMLGSREDAEDVLQEVFAAAFNAVLADEREINVRPWLYRIARNRSLNHLRRASAIGVDSMDVHFAEHGLSTGDRAIRRESFRELLADVQQLPETQRTALLLREIDALSYDQIAHAMETTVPSVKSLLVRARISLAEAAEARKLSCAEVRLELGEVAEGLTKLSAPARRHVRGCERCGSFKKQLKDNNHALAAMLPVGPLLLAKKLLLAKLGSTASAGGAHVAGGAGATVGAGAAAGAGAAGGTGVAGGILTAGAGALATKAGRRARRRRDRHRRRRRRPTARPTIIGSHRGQPAHVCRRAPKRTGRRRRALPAGEPPSRGRRSRRAPAASPPHGQAPATATTVTPGRWPRPPPGGSRSQPQAHGKPRSRRSRPRPPSFPSVEPPASQPSAPTDPPERPRAPLPRRAEPARPPAPSAPARPERHARRRPPPDAVGRRASPPASGERDPAPGMTDAPVPEGHRRTRLRTPTPSPAGTSARSARRAH